MGQENRRREIEGTEEWLRNAVQFADNCIAGYSQVRTNLSRFLEFAEIIDSTKWLLPIVLQQCTPPNQHIVQSVIEDSLLYGVPLSPVGLMTLANTGVRNMQVLITSSHREYLDKAVKGIHFVPDQFKEGPPTITGLWIVESLSAAYAYEDAFTPRSTPEDERSGKKYTLMVQGLPPPDTEGYDQSLNHLRSQYEEGNQFFPLTPQDQAFMMDSASHEAWHAWFSHARKGNPLNTVFAEELLNEILAYRSFIHRKPVVRDGEVTPDYVIQRLVQHYFQDSEPPPNILAAITACAGVAYANFDPQYQAYISWLGCLTGNVWDFIQPPINLQSQAKERSQKAMELVVQPYVQRLTTTLL